MAGDLFKEQFLPVSFHNEGPIPMTRFRHTGDLQAVSRYKFPRMPGQAGEDLGREPLVISGELLFYATIDVDLYPKRFVKVNKAKAEPGAKIFADPDLGPIEGRFTQFDVSWDPMKVNGCRVEFTFEEFSDSKLASELDRIEPLQRALSSAGTADAGLSLLGISTGQTTLTQDVVSFEEILSLPSTTVKAIEGYANAYRAKVNTILQQTELMDPRNHDLYKACRETAATVQEVAAQAKTDAPQDVPYQLDTDAWPVALALAIYGDRDRAQEIVDRNPSDKPYYPKGKELRIPDR